MVPIYFFVLAEERQERDGLNGLAKTHFVGENTIDTSLVQTDHPVEAVELVITELLLRGEHRGLLAETSQDYLIVLVLSGGIFGLSRLSGRFIEAPFGDSVARIFEIFLVIGRTGRSDEILSELLFLAAVKVVLLQYESSILLCFIKKLREPVLGSASIRKFAELFFVRRLERIAHSKEDTSH